MIPALPRICAPPRIRILPAHTSRGAVKPPSEMADQARSNGPRRIPITVGRGLRVSRTGALSRSDELLTRFDEHIPPELHGLNPLGFRADGRRGDAQQKRLLLQSTRVRDDPTGSHRTRHELRVGQWIMRNERTSIDPEAEAFTFCAQTRMSEKDDRMINGPQGVEESL